MPIKTFQTDLTISGALDVSGLIREQGELLSARYALSGTVGGGGATAFSGLTDVASTGWSSGLIGQYDGATWQPLDPDATYLRLDASNDPVTNALAITNGLQIQSDLAAGTVKFYTPNLNAYIGSLNSVSGIRINTGDGDSANDIARFYHNAISLRQDTTVVGALDATSLAYNGQDTDARYAASGTYADSAHDHDGTYLKLNGTNDPVTGKLTISGVGTDNGVELYGDTTTPVLYARSTQGASYNFQIVAKTTPGPGFILETTSIGDLYVRAAYRLQFEAAGSTWGTQYTYGLKGTMTGAGYDTSYMDLIGTYGPTGVGTGYRHRFLYLKPTISQGASNTNDYSALAINVTETAARGSENYLVEASVGGAHRFTVSSAGAIYASGISLSGTIAVNGANLDTYYEPAGAVVSHTQDVDPHDEYLLADGSRNLTGPIYGVDPTVAQHLATKNYVDSATGMTPTWGRVENEGTQVAALSGTYYPATGYTDGTTADFESAPEPISIAVPFTPVANAIDTSGTLNGSDFATYASGLYQRTRVEIEPGPPKVYEIQEDQRALIITSGFGSGTIASGLLTVQYGNVSTLGNGGSALVYYSVNGGANYILLASTSAAVATAELGLGSTTLEDLRIKILGQGATGAGGYDNRGYAKYYGAHFRESVLEGAPGIDSVYPLTSGTRVAIGHQNAKFDLDATATSGTVLGAALPVPFAKPTGSDLKNNQYILYFDSNDAWILRKDDGGTLTSGQIATLA